MTGFLRKDLAQLWDVEDALDNAFDLQGEVYREVSGRRTLRVELGGRPYFAKLHYGVGWAEILKNWMQLKRPVVGAENEYEACRILHQRGLPAPVPAAFGQEPGSFASRRSFILCDELADRTSLEDVTDAWLETPASAALRHRSLYAVAQFARQFHQLGFIHRDFYICHLLADNKALQTGRIELAVLDLHRARHFATIPDRWLKRDLAALLYSVLDLGYSRAQWLRFVRIYTGRPLQQEFSERGAFWRQVLKRAHKLYEQGLRKGLVKGLYVSDAGGSS